MDRQRFKIENLERSVAQLKSDLTSQENTLAHAMDGIHTPLNIVTKEEGQDQIKEEMMGLFQKRKLKHQFKEWDLRYQDVVSAFVREEK